MATLLVIEREAATRRALDTVLSDHGHEVVSARSGLEGLEVERLGSFDVVLIDLELPDINGLEVLDRMRERGSETKALLLATDLGSLAIGQTLLDRLGCGLVGKPVAPPDLLSAVQACMTPEDAPGEESTVP
jgi:DNA-binding response OmpR family regulator